jgi:hypothetical protein
MPDLDHRAGRCSPVTLSDDKALSPIRACSHLHPPGSGRLGAAHCRCTADCRSRSRPAWRHPTTSTSGPVPFIRADRKRE